jgi:hypothetical protein
MMIGRSLISVVEAPNVSYICDLVITALEEFLEIFSRFNNLWQPNKGWQIFLSSSNMSTS